MDPSYQPVPTSQSHPTPYVSPTESIRPVSSRGAPGYGNRDVAYQQIPLAQAPMDGDPQEFVPTVHKKEPQVHVASARTDSISQQRTPLRTTLMSWSFEILAILISIGALIAIVVILYQENNKPSQDWTLNVSINTVISTLGTLARTTLAFALSACVGQQKWSWLYKKSDRMTAFERFDEAAKGPWGGTKLFIWLRARHWAALGAFVIMGTVAFDPFLQAVISTQGQLDVIAQGANATVGKASRVEGGSFEIQIQKDTSSTASSIQIQVMSRPDFGLVGSAYNGLRNPAVESKDPIDSVCTSGNCTWPVFTSAGVCSSCADVTSALEKIAGYGPYGVSIPWSNSPVWSHNLSYTRWALPYAEMRNYDDDRNFTNTFKYPRSQMILNTTLAALSTVTYRHLNDTVLMAFAIIKGTDDFNEGRALWKDTHPIATECVLYLCTQAYQTVATNNALDERVVETWSQKEKQSYEVVDATYRSYDDDEFKAEDGIFETNRMRTDMQLTIPDDALNSSTSIDRRFNITQSFVYNAIRTLRQITERAEQVKEDVDKGWAWHGYNNVGYPSMDKSDDVKMPIIIDALWSTKNFSTLFGNVARSITSQVRNTSPDRQEGFLQQWTIHVRVKWEFLSFPVAMLAAGILYVVLVIMESTRLGVPVWKERVRPTLLYGFNDVTQQRLREEAEAKISTMTVRYRLDEKEECLRLIAD